MSGAISPPCRYTETEQRQKASRSVFCKDGDCKVFCSFRRVSCFTWPRSCYRKRTLSLIGPLPETQVREQKPAVSTIIFLNKNNDSLKNGSRFGIQGWK